MPNETDTKIADIAQPTSPPSPLDWLLSRGYTEGGDVWMEVYLRLADKTRPIGEIGRDLQDLAALLVIGNRK